MPDEIATTEEVKVGSRHSAADNAHLQNAIEEILQAGGSHPRIQVETPEVTEIPLVPDKTVINFGGEVKAMPDGKVGGYLVTFGGIDLTGEYFDQQTDFGEFARLPVLYHHGFDEKLKTRRIGTAEVKPDDVGLWAEAQLNLRDEYEKMIYELAQKGKLGWSSGAAAHVATREPDAKGIHITQWYMAEASLTPTPAEPRNSVIPLKSYLGDNTATPKPEGDPEAATAAESEGKDIAEPIHPEPIGETAMEITSELQALLGQVAEDAVKKFRESEPATKTADVVVVKDEADQPWKNPGEFFMAVKTAAYFPSEINRKLLPLKAATGANETVPSQGGFLVPTEYASGILENTWNTGQLLSQFRPISVGGNAMTFNAIDESSRADGYRYGGIQGYWLEEAGTKTSSKPKFKQINLKLKKLAALVYATDELLEDASALQSWINNTVPLELRFKVEDAIVNGSGAGMPLGILNSGALKTVTRNDATEIDADDVLTMWANRYPGANDYFWCANPSIFPQLASMSIGNVPVFLPAGGLSGLPYSTLLGRPLFETEYNPTLGEIGDLLLVSPSNYLMIEKAGGVQAASSIHVAFTTDQTAFRFVLRIDGAPAWTSTVTSNDGTNTYGPFVALTTST